MVERKTKALVDAGLVEESSTTHGFAATTVLPSKKDAEGKTVDWRMCGDYRALHAATVSDRYVMPTPEEIFDNVGEAQMFSTLDLRQGFHQIPMHPDHRHKTAFWAGSQLMEWAFMPFGLKNAPSKFQRVMDGALQGLPFARCYIDDILIYSPSFEEHLAHLTKVFECLERVNLTCHPGKCVFAVKEVMYLGHLLRPRKLASQEAKVRAI